MGNEQSRTTLSAEEEEFHRLKGREDYERLVEQARLKAKTDAHARKEQAEEEDWVQKEAASIEDQSRREAAEKEERLRASDKLLQAQNEAWAAQLKAEREAEEKQKADADAAAKAADESNKAKAAAEAKKLAAKKAEEDRLEAEKSARAKTQAANDRAAERQALAKKEAALTAEIARRKPSAPVSTAAPIRRQQPQDDSRNPGKPENGSLPVRPSIETQDSGARPAAKGAETAISDSEEDPLSSWNPRKQPRQGPGTESSKNSAGGSKRQAAPSVYGDDRRSSVAKRPRTSMSSAGFPKSPESPADDDVRRPPQWYRDLKVINKRGRDNDSSNADIALTSLKEWIVKAKAAQKDHELQRAFIEVRKRLHRLAFEAGINAQLLRNKNILGNENGLPQIFDPKYDGEVQWPYDIKADAEELYNKWCLKDFDIDLLRGIEQKRPGQEGGDKVKPGFQKNARYFGNGKLLNGQWWPTLICAFRDGAHGETMRGVCGKKGEGAYSVFMSGGGDNPYPDIDDGDIVQYCGTDDENKTRKIMPSTQMLLDGMANNQPVRFIRSAKAKDKSAWAPSRGFRYDGLYAITKVEILDQELQRHRFTLVRRPGQGEIRGGLGPHARPTKEEVEAYDKDKRLMKGTV